MWFYYLLALRNLIRFGTKPEFEEDRKQIAAAGDQLEYDMAHWSDEERVARWRAAGYRFVERLVGLIIVIILLCGAWYQIVMRHEAAGQPPAATHQYQPIDMCEMYNNPPPTCK